MGYLPKAGVGFELIEFRSNGRDVQGGIFSANPKLFAPSTIAVVLVHGVESYWYSAPISPKPATPYWATTASIRETAFARRNLNRR